jgi:hypothetical protein
MSRLKRLLSMKVDSSGVSSFGESISLTSCTAFFDFTIPVKTDSLDGPLPLPPIISWDGLGNTVNIVQQDPNGNPALEVPNEAESKPTTWHDVALSIAAEWMLKSRTEVKKQLGYTTSAVRTVFPNALTRS